MGPGQLFRRAAMLLRRRATERSMDDELRDHIDAEIAERVRSGMSASEARRTALRDFGTIESVKEAARDARGIRPLEDLVADLRLGSRMLTRNPAFTIAAAGTLALGVSAVTAIFSLVYGILLRPLPYERPGQLVAAWETNASRNRNQNVASLENYDAWRAQARSFSAFEAVVPTSLTFQNGDAPERIAGAEVSAGYFGLLGIAPALGRDFDKGDESSGAAVILSDSLWRRSFGASPDVVGTGVRMGSRLFTVVGIMPATFEPPRWGWLGEQDLWIPLVSDAQKRSWGRFLLVLARLRDGISLEQARAEMAGIGQRTAASSTANDGWSASIVPLTTQITGEVSTSLLVWLSAGTLILFIAIANVGTLTLSMTRRRSRELAVKRSIGATEGRLFRQLFAQSALLGAAGTTLGVLLAVPGIRALVSILPADTPRLGSISIDAPVLSVAALAGLLATIVVGALAALRGREARGTALLAREMSGGPASRPRTKGSLISIQVAVALALSVMAVLMARSYAGLRGVDLGFDSRDVLLSRIALPQDAYDAPTAQATFFTDLSESTAVLPGVRAVGLISARPIGGVGPATTVHDNARPTIEEAKGAVADVRYASSGLLAAMGMKLEGGRWLADRASRSAAPEVVVNVALARSLWPDDDAVGEELAIRLNGGLVARVVGVVRDLHLRDARTPARPLAFLSIARFPSPVADLVVRHDGPAGVILPALRTALAGKDPTLPLYSVETLEGLVDEATQADRLTAILLIAFAILALALSSVGVFGVFASDIHNRRKEIGIRLALGAQESRVIVMMLKESLGRASKGIALGLILATVLGRAMRSLLFGVSSFDLFSLVSVTALIVTMTLLVTLAPTRRAIRSRPMAALRED